ncbi:BatA domain-containing protein [Flavobacteriaceae bacterium F89]|uniref:BatA domain-containing protein n=1 Tax=Cerina litoralis TaxID=2874477 RepID=A0AAE3EWZ6_9FLAO|nr:BatA domain-containing protein [Cerina litoralis]MCG2462010.1 BatA domain-containing protein [Cerina litoralis]
MQFKYPELLWALLLLLIPILIHFFQLRRFKKTHFTNVKFLKKVVSESRKSRRLKKWLLLCTRLLLLVALILAFAQPFFANDLALKEKETVVYLDDSFSMQAKNNNESLLGSAVQELISEFPKDKPLSLFTNEKTFRNVRVKDIQNDLLNLSFTPKQLLLNEIDLKAGTLFGKTRGTIKNLILISDFQQRMVSEIPDSVPDYRRYLVQLSPDPLENISIDTVFLSKTGSENNELTVSLSGSTGVGTIPVSLTNGDKLIAKTSANFNGDQKAEISFSLPSNAVVNGKVEITDPGLAYDNKLFFNINKKKKIKVMTISEGNDEFLGRIYKDDSFQFRSFSLTSLNYSLLDNQNLIILNELPQIPTALQNALRSFKKNGGSIVVIPSNTIDTTSYNQFLANFYNTSFLEKISQDLDITGIAFSHPLYQQVFEKKTTNFQYPKVSEYYSLSTSAPPILSFGNKAPFLIGSDGVYLFSASLSTQNSNFKNSPLIVPTFFNIGDQSLKLPKLYNLMGPSVTVDVPVGLSKDQILKVSQDNYEFIPRQRAFANKTELSFGDNLDKDGIFTIKAGNSILQNISFNYPREESILVYLNPDNINAISKQGSIPHLIDDLVNDDRVVELWKWFVILALIFFGIEVLIQKLK